MFSFPRSAARRLRLLARKSLAGRPRGLAPPVWVYPDHRGITMAVTPEEVTIAVTVPGVASLKVPGWLPMEALDCVEGAGDDLIHVAAGNKEQKTLNWTDRGLSRSQSFVVPKLKPVELPQSPKSTKPVPSQFLQAFHEAGKSTARDANRYALQRVQIRGKAGEVIGTDSYFVYRHEGFQLPFSQDLLVPAVPLFGLDEWAKAKEIRVGRTDKHVVVVADDVTAFLTIDAAGRYPDVASVFPRSPTPATLTLDPQDALFLLDALPTLPGNEDEHRPVTLDLVTGSAAIVRATSPKTKEIVEVQLPRSPVKSGPMRIAVDRRYLARMLTLGCRSFRVFTEHRPVIGTGESITTLLMPVDSDLIVKPSPQARVLTPDSPPITLRSSPVKTPEPINNVPADGEVPDPLVEAEALRNALGEAQHRLGRLLIALRSKKKEQKALTQVWSSLKSLNLGG